MKLAKGGLIDMRSRSSRILDMMNESRPVELSKGQITVKQSVYDKYGSDKLRELNKLPLATIVIIDDVDWDKMTPSERCKL